MLGLFGLSQFFEVGCDVTGYEFVVLQHKGQISQKIVKTIRLNSEKLMCKVSL